MTEPSADWYEERGRVWLRAEMDYKDFLTLQLGLRHPSIDGAGWDALARLAQAIEWGQREKSDQSDIMARFDDNPPLGDA